MTVSVSSEFQAIEAQYTPLVDAALHHFLTASFDDNRRELERAISHSVFGQAKRIRPLLAISSYRLFRDDITAILPFAAALEMIHTYSLIHDDLPAMDNDDWRRGKPTCHKQFGESTAILAGDTLNTAAFELMAQELPVHFPPDRVLKAITQFARACGISGMSGGQALDLKPPANPTLSDLEQIHALKTGALLHACLVIPGILVGAATDAVTPLSQLGKSIGMLFQIVDDILDVTRSKAELGKSPMKDAAQNKLTYVQFLGLDGARKMADQYYRQGCDYLNDMRNAGLHSDELSVLVRFIYERPY